MLPGLIDAHGHASHCLIRTLGEQSTHWISMANEIYDRFTDDFFWYADGALAAAERLKFGITTGVSMMGSSSRCDRVELLEAHFEGSLKTGIRQFAGLGCAAPPWPKTIRHWQGDSFREYEAHPRDAAVNARQALLRTCFPSAPEAAPWSWAPWAIFSRRLSVPAPRWRERRKRAPRRGTSWPAFWSCWPP